MGARLYGSAARIDPCLAIAKKFWARAEFRIFPISATEIRVITALVFGQRPTSAAVSITKQNKNLIIFLGKTLSSIRLLLVLRNYLPVSFVVNHA